MNPNHSNHCQFGSRVGEFLILRMNPWSWPAGLQLALQLALRMAYTIHLRWFGGWFIYSCLTHIAPNLVSNIMSQHSTAPQAWRIAASFFGRPLQPLMKGVQPPTRTISEITCCVETTSPVCHRMSQSEQHFDTLLAWIPSSSGWEAMRFKTSSNTPFGERSMNLPTKRCQKENWHQNRMLPSFGWKNMLCQWMFISLHYSHPQGAPHPRCFGEKKDQILSHGPAWASGSISMLLKIPKQNYLPILGWFPLLTIMFGQVVVRLIQFVQANWKASGQRHPDNSRNLAGLL